MAVSTATQLRKATSTATRLTPITRLIIDIITVGRHAPRPVGVEASTIVDWCRRNKFPLLSVESRLPRWMIADPFIAHELSIEREWYSLQREEYLSVQRLWSTRGIESLLIKPAGSAPSFPHTSDNIDVLVHQENGRNARQALRDLGYVEVRNVEEPEKYLFRRFRDGRCVSAIHVHERIAWFVEFFMDGEVWKRSRPAPDDSELTIPSYEDAVLINLAHACYENKELRLLEIIRVRHVLETASQGFDWSYLQRAASRRGWADGLAFMLMSYAAAERVLFGETLIPSDSLSHFESMIQSDEPVMRRLSAIEIGQIDDLPLDLSYGFCKRLYYRKILKDPERRPGDRARDVAATLIWGIRLKSGFRPQPGMVISLSGPDGSGKTAQAETLLDAMRQCEIRADYFWNRGGSSGILGMFARIRRKPKASRRASEPSDSDAIIRRQSRLRNPFVRFGWAWIVCLDQVATYWWRVVLPAALGRVIVTDRYVYDTAVEMNSTLQPGDRWSRLAIATMLRLVPKPSISYFLDVSFETARDRKPDEHWHASWETQREAYRLLAAKQGAELISTEGKFATSSDLLVHRVIMTFMAQYETLRNSVFYSNPSQKNEPDPVWAGGSVQ